MRAGGKFTRLLSDEPRPRGWCKLGSSIGALSLENLSHKTKAPTICESSGLLFCLYVYRYFVLVARQNYRVAILESDVECRR